MVIGFGEPPRRRFYSPMREKALRTREYYYSLLTVVVVKIILFVFLWGLFGSTIVIMRTIFKNISMSWRCGLPAAVAIVAIIIGYQIYKNIKGIIEYRRELEQSQKSNSRL